MISTAILLAYDPNDVKPGWVALIIVALLGVATFLLWRSMNTQLGRIQIPKKGEAPQTGDDVSTEGQAEPPPSDEDGQQGEDRPPAG